jgi:hypothetical protein
MIKIINPLFLANAFIVLDVVIFIIGLAYFIIGPISRLLVMIVN